MQCEAIVAFQVVAGGIVASPEIVDEVVAGIFQRSAEALQLAVQQGVCFLRGSIGMTPLEAAACMLWPLGVKVLLDAGSDGTTAAGFVKSAVADLRDAAYAEACQGVEAAVEILQLLHTRGVPLEFGNGRGALSWQVCLAAEMAARKGYNALDLVIRRAAAEKRDLYALK
jgi:hypothetical protein